MGEREQVCGTSCCNICESKFLPKIKSLSTIWFICHQAHWMSTVNLNLIQLIIRIKNKIGWWFQTHCHDLKKSSLFAGAFPLKQPYPYASAVNSSSKKLWAWLTLTEDIGREHYVRIVRLYPTQNMELGYRQWRQIFKYQQADCWSNTRLSPPNR